MSPRWGPGGLGGGVSEGPSPGRPGPRERDSPRLGGTAWTFSTVCAQTALPVGGLGPAGPVGLGGPRSGPHETRSPKGQASRPGRHVARRGLPARGSGLRTKASPSPGSPEPTGSTRPGRLHLALRSAVWETESSAGRAPGLPRLKHYISHKAPGRDSRGLSGCAVFAHAPLPSLPSPEMTSLLREKSPELIL